MNIVFIRPVFLWLLISIPILILTHFFVLRFLKRRALKFANFEAIKRVTGSEGSVKNTTMMSKNIPLLILKCLILLTLILSAAEPVVYYLGRSATFSYTLAIDSSSSMLAQDFSPDRLSAAKKAANSFIDAVSSQTSIGVVSFAGASLIEQPLTKELSTVRTAINNIKISKIGGTSIGDALITSVNVLSGEEKAKTVILLSDGQSNVGTSPDDGIAYAKKNSVIVHCIGVGTAEGGSFIRSNLVSRLDEETLKKIAQETGGMYYRAEDEASFVAAYKEIASYSKQDLHVNLAGGLLIAAIVMLFLEWGLINTRYRTLP